MQTSSRLQSIDVLRGLAILMVVAGHIPHDAPGGWRENPWSAAGFLVNLGYGVPLFILISGFSIHRAAAAGYAATGSYEFDWSRFWKRRFIRLYPPYLAAIAFSLFSAFWLHSRYAEPESFLGWDLATHLLLIHNLTDEFSSTLGNGALWTMGVAEQLYLLYFGLLMLVARASWARVLLLIAALGIGWRIALPHMSSPGLDLGPFHLGSWHWWPFSFWLHWTLGAYAAEVYVGNRKLPAWSASLRWGLAFLALALLLKASTFAQISRHFLGGESLFGLGSTALGTAHQLGRLVALVGLFCLMNFLVAREVAVGLGGVWLAALAWIGRISYSLYLVHVPVIAVLYERLPMGGSAVEWPLRYLAYGSIVLAAGYLFHQGVERWFLRGRVAAPVPKPA